MLRVVVVGVVSLCAATASAEQWAEKMFAERSHDFGAVPRAAKVEYEFELTNLYQEDVHISSVRSSCGCTQPRIAKDTLKTHEKGAIVAAFNTNAFTGQRGATVTVTIDRPQYAEVRLDVRGYIRTDIVLNPGQVNLGSVGEGQAADKTIRIEYAGRNDWQITDVKSNSPFLTASVREASRSGGRVAYELDVQLKGDAPSGYLNDELQLLTNDRRATRFPVKVEGLVVSELTVSPTSLNLGTLQPYQKVTKQIVVKGVKPFKIVQMQCANNDFSFQPGDEAKIVHLVPVTFEAREKIGKLTEKITIVTDLGPAAESGQGKQISLHAIGQVAAPLAGK